MRPVVVTIAAIVILGRAMPLSAQTERANLPTSREQWINSAPITLEVLRGKGAILYFFEET